MAALIPLLFVFIFIFAVIKKVKIYPEFTRGAGEAISFTMSLIPCLAAVFMMCELMEASGISALLQKALAPLFKVLGIPSELTKLLLIKPFSGSGSLAYLTEIIKNYGADSYIARCACVCFGSSETVFYISAVYFSKTRQKKLALPIFTVLLSTFISAIIACLLCKII